MSKVKVTKQGGQKPASDQQDLRAYMNLTSIGDIGVTKYVQDIAKMANVQPQSRSRSFSINSYNWSEDYTPDGIIKPDVDSIQQMIITEFQPDFSFQWGKTNDMVVSVAEKGIKMVPFGDLALKGAGLALEAGAADANQKLQKEYISQPDKVVGTPIDFIKGLFKGTYINSFEVPFFSDTYLKADTTGNWSAGGAAQAIGEKAAEIMKSSMAVDFPTTPTWQLSDSATREDISVEFYLINNSTGHLINNFRFLNSIITGAYWVQMDYIQKSPNVYDIHVPGRFHIYFAAMGVEIKHVGKLRKNPDVYKRLNINGINNSTLYPDAYHITLNIHDLCPNNFNNYVDYLMNGAGGQVQVGKTTNMFMNEHEAKKLLGVAKNGVVEGVKKVKDIAAGLIS